MKSTKCTGTTPVAPLPVGAGVAPVAPTPPPAPVGAGTVPFPVAPPAPVVGLGAAAVVASPPAPVGAGAAPPAPAAPPPTAIPPPGEGASSPTPPTTGPSSAPGLAPAIVMILAGTILLGGVVYLAVMDWSYIATGGGVIAPVPPVPVRPPASRSNLDAVNESIQIMGSSTGKGFERLGKRLEGVEARVEVLEKAMPQREAIASAAPVEAVVATPAPPPASVVASPAAAVPAATVPHDCISEEVVKQFAKTAREMREAVEAIKIE